MKTIIPNDAFLLLPISLRLKLFNGDNPLSLIEKFFPDEEFFLDYYYTACSYQVAVHKYSSFAKFLDKNLKF